MSYPGHTRPTYYTTWPVFRTSWLQLSCFIWHTPIVKLTRIRPWPLHEVIPSLNFREVRSPLSLFIFRQFSGPNKGDHIRYSAATKYRVTTGIWQQYIWHIARQMGTTGVCRCYLMAWPRWWGRGHLAPFGRQHVPKVKPSNQSDYPEHWSWRDSAGSLVYNLFALGFRMMTCTSLYGGDLADKCVQMLYG